MADLETMTRDTLFEHYRRFYIPNNAVLAIAGDFRTGPMRKRIRELFGKIPRGERPEFQPRLEPEQRGERHVTVEGPGETPFLYVGYHAPPGADPDFYPLAVLDSVLTGASNLNFFGAGISNKTSRLYRALVEGELAASVRGGLAATIDPYLYSINVTVRPDHTTEETLKVLDREVNRLLEQPIAREELVKAKKQARALFAYNSESITNQAFWLGFSEMFATYKWFESYLDRLVEVTSEDVLEAARKYLRPSNRIVGVYRPQVDESDD
jgi:zinc protease